MPKFTNAQLARLHVLCKAVGNFIEYWGFKKTQGEVWMYLYASDRPLSVEQVQAFFGFSRALVHLVLGELTSYGLVQRVKVKGIRRAHFQVTDDVWTCISNVLSSRERRIILMAKKAVEEFEVSLGTSTPEVVQKRIRFLRNLCSYSLHALNLLIQGSMIPGRVEDNISKLWKKFQAIKPFGKHLRLPVFMGQSPPQLDH